MEEKIVGHNEYSTGLEELYRQFELFEEDLNIPNCFFAIRAPGCFGRLPLGEVAREPVEARLGLRDESHLMNYGLKGIKAAYLASLLVRQFKYNGYYVMGEETKKMPLRVHVSVQHDTLMHAFQKWERKLEDLCFNHGLINYENGEPLLFFEIRTRARSIGTEYVNLFIHVNFDHLACTFDNMEEIAKAYQEAMELIWEFPYNNFELVNEKGEPDSTTHGTWLNKTHF